MGDNLKYVRLKAYDSIIIFPDIIQHSRFQYMEPISAGFCRIMDGKVHCYGKSISLGLISFEEDSDIATKQVFRQY